MFSSQISTKAGGSGGGRLPWITCRAVPYNICVCVCVCWLPFIHHCLQPWRCFGVIAEYFVLWSKCHHMHVLPLVMQKLDNVARELKKPSPSQNDQRQMVLLTRLFFRVIDGQSPTEAVLPTCWHQVVWTVNIFWELNARAGSSVPRSCK